MGGIAGIIRFDGQRVSPDQSNIIALLKHRGTVLSQEISQGMLMAFGGTLESNIAPSVCATVDADIYANPIPDRPFLTNFLRTGASSFNDLNADFAVALWDAHQQILVCARDPLGIKPLYYVHQPGRFFAFASEIKALLALREVHIKPNQHKFREYLTWTTTFVPYSSETFYETIYSVLPGHYLQVNSQDAQIHPYWQPDLKKFNGLDHPKAYSSLFHEYFTTAIDHRIKKRKLVGAHLSGGLDSSSASCMAQSLLMNQHRPSLHTFSIDTQQPSANEQEFIQAVVDRWRPNHHTVRPVEEVLDSVLKITRQFDRPEQFIIPSSFHLSVSLEAQQIGCDILLTGHDGDSAAPFGFDYVDQLLDAQNWEQLQVACQQMVSTPGRNLAYISTNWFQLSDQAKYEKYVLSIISTDLKKRFKNQSGSDFLRALYNQKRFFGLSSVAILSYIAKRVQDKISHQVLIDNALSADFKQKFPQRSQQTTHELVTRLSTECQAPFNQIINITNIICNEQMNHIGAYHGHLYSFPFFDKNVIELGLATPLEVHFNQGRGRGLIRNGLRDILPSAIVSRQTKANFVEYGTLTAQQLYKATYDQFKSPGHSIWEVIDRPIFSKIVEIVFNPRYPAKKKTRYNWLASRILYLGLWLDSLPTKN